MKTSHGSYGFDTCDFVSAALEEIQDWTIKCCEWTLVVCLSLGLCCLRGFPIGPAALFRVRHHKTSCDEVEESEC